MAAVIRAALAMGLLLWAIPARATVYDVCASGCDYTLPSTCWAALATGDVCEVENGTYSDGMLSRSSAVSSITVRGKAGHRPLMDGGGTVNMFLGIEQEGCTVENMDLTGYDLGCISVTGAPVYEGTLTVRDVEIYGCSGDAVIQFGRVGTLIEDSVIRDNTSPANWGAISYLGVSSTGTDFTVRNVLIYGNTRQPMWMYGAPNDAVVEHVTATGNCTAGGTWELDVGTTGTSTVRYSVGSKAGGCGSGARAAVYSRNDLYGYTTACSGSCDGNTVTTTPNLSVYYVPQPTSGAIDLAVGSAVTTDLAGLARDANPDAGALEYEPPPPAMHKRVDGGVPGLRVDGGVPGKRVD